MSAFDPKRTSCRVRRIDRGHEALKRYPRLMSRPPSEGRGHSIIPDGTYGRASDASDPPDRLLLSEQKAGDTDVSNCPKAADQSEGHKSAYEPQSGQAAIVVS